MHRLLVALAAMATMLLGVTAAPAGAATSKVFGTVTGPGGSPLGGITVTAWTWTDASESQQLVKAATTGAGGTYALEVPAGLPLVVCVETATWVHECFDDVARPWTSTAYREGTPVVATGGGVTGIDAQLVAGGAASGTVADERGAVAGAFVSLRLQGSLLVWSTTTDATGAWSVDRLVPGTYTICSWTKTLIKRCTGHAGQPASPAIADGAATAGLDLTFVARPRGLAVAKTGPTSVQWSWDAHPGATQYRVSLATRSDMANATVRWVTSRWFTLNDADPSRTWYAAIRAADSGGTSVTILSPVVSGRAGAVAGLRAEATAASLTWTWKPYLGAASYDIRLSSSPTFDAQRRLTTTGRQVTWGGLKPGTTYYAKVLPRDTSGAAIGRWSPVASATTD